MNFRELLIERVFGQLGLLKVPADQIQAIQQGEFVITPNEQWNGVLREVDYGPLDHGRIDRQEPPLAYVSWDGGRHDLAEDTFLTHVVETLGIRVEVLLDKKITVRQGDDLRSIEFQVSDLLGDMDHLINHASMQSALNGLDDYTVQDVVMEEWELDERYRGGPKEVLSIIFQTQVANPKDPTASG